MFDSMKITVIGAGLMGCGISQVFACAGLSVTLYDPFEEARNDAHRKIAENLKSINQDPSIAEKVMVTSDLNGALAEADVVIEAVPERVELKREVFATCLKVCRPTCILASNTSVIPIKEVAGDMQFSGRIVGTHWWNPPYLVPLVEVVQSEQTSDETVSTMMQLLEYVGKSPAHIEKDVAGFVGNRLQHALWREAISLVNDGVCSAETLDSVVKNSFGMRLPVLGPIENADLVGLDLTLNIHDVILPTLNRDSEPAAILRQKVQQNELGVKTGTGFKRWTDQSVSTLRQTLAQHLVSATNKKG